MKCTPRQRRLFVGCVMICILGTYLWAALLHGAPLYAAGFWAFSLYIGIWFAKPVITAFWLVSHSLFALSCRWLLRSDELRMYMFTLMLACILSYWGALAAGILLHSAMVGHKAVPF